MKQTFDDIYNKFLLSSGFEDSMFEPYTDFSMDVLERMSILYTCSLIKHGELLFKGDLPDLVFNDYFSGNKCMLTVQKDIKKSLLYGVAEGYGWEICANEFSSELIRNFAGLTLVDRLANESIDGWYKRASSIISDLAYIPSVVCGDFLTDEVYDFLKSKLSLSNVQCCYSLLQELIETEEIDYVDSFSVLRLRCDEEHINKMDFDENFFSSLFPFNNFFDIPFIRCFCSSGYYWIIITSMWYDDLSLRIGDVVGLGYMQITGLTLFKDFNKQISSLCH